MAFSSNNSAFTIISKANNVERSDSFSRICEEESSWQCGLDNAKYSRSTTYKEGSSSRYVSTNSKVIRTVTTKKTITKKQTISTNTKTPTAEKHDDKLQLSLGKDAQELATIEDDFKNLSTGSFFKASYKDMNDEDFFRSASSRFSMRNLNDKSGWTFDMDERASLFPDFFPKNDAATKLSLEAAWRSVSPIKEMGLAKQAIKNISCEEEQNNDDKTIVKSWMQFFGQAKGEKQ